MKLASDDAIGSVAHRLGLLEAMVRKAIAKRPAAALRTSMKSTNVYAGTAGDDIEARVRRLEGLVMDL